MNGKKILKIGIILSVVSVILFIAAKIYLEMNPGAMFASSFGYGSIMPRIVNWTLVLSVPLFLVGLVLLIIGGVSQGRDGKPSNDSDVKPPQPEQIKEEKEIRFK
ncbi:MAG: hypothetical protein J0L62_02980 [Bacteroidetes bacterium]|nr:hypothetical protein [Bacteroidota bacterium]